MILLLQKNRSAYSSFDNYYASDAQVKYYDSLISNTTSEQDRMIFTYQLAHALIALGLEEKAIPLLEEQVEKINRNGINGMNKLKAELALAYLRSGERANCIHHHSAETCILPIRGAGIHKLPEGSTKAIGMYAELLSLYPDNMEYRWLLNIAYMTLGNYPSGVPEKFLLPGFDMPLNTDNPHAAVNPFIDIATALHLDVNNMAGGSITDDFDNDGYIDIITSTWDLDNGIRFFRNNTDETFTDISESSGLEKITGGLNLLQTDYNNDGYKDIFVMRGAWLRRDYCKQPNSLIRNNGDGTFTDVTTASGVLSFHPTQTATWNDFNNDGWLDVFIGNETWEENASSGEHPCELYLNNQDGTFTNVAREAGCDITGFVKGVASGDYDNDGWIDLFISTLSGKRYLLKNRGCNGKISCFEDVTKQSNLDDGFARTFPTWFWDYNNDGWLDILVCDFTFDKPLTAYAAAEALGRSVGTSGTVILYRNNANGTFTNVSKETGVNRVAFAMGANFGDIDNDGYLDFYLGTGNPELESVIPNKLFRNVAGKHFLDITLQSRTGHLQKGHAISFADLDNDGDQDIYVQMGGAYKGDAFHNTLYLNPGQNKQNNWISIELTGTKANRFAIGSRIKLTFTEDGIKRSVYRDVNSGGSFGASPLRKEIGTGRAKTIDEISITWHPSGYTQSFTQIEANQFIRITEGKSEVEKMDLKQIRFNESGRHSH